MPVTHGVRGSSPLRTAKEKTERSSLFFVRRELGQRVASRLTCLRWVISVGELLRNYQYCAYSQKANKFPFRLSTQHSQLRCPPTLLSLLGLLSTAAAVRVTMNKVFWEEGARRVAQQSRKSEKGYDFQKIIATPIAQYTQIS